MQLPSPAATLKVDGMNNSTPRRHVGGSLLPSSSPRILQPFAGLQVRVIEAEDTHGLFDIESGELLAKHPNGFSCYSLAERIRDGRRAIEQADYIVACAGVVTEAGRQAIAKAESGQ